MKNRRHVQHECSIYSCNTVFELLVQHSVRVTRATRSSPLRATAFSIYTYPGTAIRYSIVALGCLLSCEHHTHTLLTHTFHIFNTHTHLHAPTRTHTQANITDTQHVQTHTHPLHPPPPPPLSHASGVPYDSPVETLFSLTPLFSRIPPH